jgi:hypothetical protein
VINNNCFNMFASPVYINRRWEAPPATLHDQP